MLGALAWQVDDGNKKLCFVVRGRSHGEVYFFSPRFSPLCLVFSALSLSLFPFCSLDYHPTVSDCYTMNVDDGRLAIEASAALLIKGITRDSKSEFVIMKLF